MSTPIRILQVVTNMSYGGLENFIMNNYRNIDRERVQFDFLTHFAGHQDYEEEIAALGGRIYRLPKLNPFDGKYLKQLDAFFASHPEYKVVHSHMNCFSGIILKAAKKNGATARIAHSHIVLEKKADPEYILKNILKKDIPKYATDYFACGEDAGKFMFGKEKFTVINNSIDAAAYRYDLEKARKVREQWGLGDSFVIGHVGMFRAQKNHPFLFEIVKYIAGKDPSVRLMSVGNGPLFEEMKEKAKQIGADKYIVFTDGREDVPELMQAMDVFVLPSLFEGFPVTMVEAQAAGLPCVISDRVAKECKLTEDVVPLSLDDPLEKWADTILKYKDTEKKDNFELICRAGFDIKENAKRLEEFYVEKYNG